MEGCMTVKETATLISPSYLPRNLPNSSSVSSFYSSDYGQGSYLITGGVLVALWHEDDILYIKIAKAENLAGAKEGTWSDPYVKTYLTPDPLFLTKRRTNGQNKTNNPVYNEIIKYDLPRRAIGRTVLFLSIWDREACGRNLFLGQSRFPLCSLDLKDSTEKWYELKNKKNDPEPLFIGRIYINMKYDSKSNSLLIKIKSCKNLPVLNTKVHTKYFVRLFLLPDLSTSSKRKTKLVKVHSNPVWKEQFSYHASTDELEHRVLEITLWSVDKEGFYNFNGCVRLGPKPHKENYLHKEWMDSFCSEYTCWNVALAFPDQLVRTHHKLRPTMVSRFEYDSLDVDTHYRDSDGNTSECTDVLVRGDYNISGELLLKLDYQDEILYIDIVKAQNLAAAKTHRLSDPFLKMQVLQGKCKHFYWKSTVKQNTLNPLFNNTFTFKIKEFYFSLFTLFFSIWDKNNEGKNKFLGQIKIKLSNSTISRIPQWFNFVEDCETNSNSASEVGQLSLSLNFKVSEIINSLAHGKLVIRNISAKELPKEEGQDCNLRYFVKLYLLPFKASQFHKKMKQSMVVESGCNPVWNEDFEYDDVTLEQLSDEHVLEVTVWEEILPNESNFIGGLRIGPKSNVNFTKKWMDSSDQEAEHWEEMLLNRNCCIDRCHQLRPSMHYRNSSIDPQTFGSYAECSQIPDLENPLSLSQMRTAVAIAASPNDERSSMYQLVVSLMFLINNKKKKTTGNLYVKLAKPEPIPELTKDVLVECHIFSRSHFTSEPEIMKNPENPHWGHLYIFENQRLDELLSNRWLEISIWQNSHKDVLVGRVCLGPDPTSSVAKSSLMDSNEKEIQHWQEVFANLNEWVEVLHHLRA